MGINLSPIFMRELNGLNPERRFIQAALSSYDNKQKHNITMPQQKG